jgi:hypothetical protein
MIKGIYDHSHEIIFLKRFKVGISKFIGIIPYYGFIGALGQIIKNLLWFEIMYRFCKDLRVVEEKKIQAKIPIRIVQFGQDLDLDRWDGKQEILKIRGDYGLNQFRERLDEGDILFCAYSGVYLAGFLWLNSSNYMHSGITLNTDENYHMDGWVFHEYRGNNILAVMQQAVAYFVRKERPNIRYLVSHGAAWNKATLSGQQKAGMIPVARELSVSFLGYNKKFKLNDVHSSVS